MTIQETITNQIVEAIEGGKAGSFKMPWFTNGGANELPRNVVSGKAYRGVNIAQLWCSALLKGYSSNLWGTYKQWQEIGAQVRKGEKSTQVVFWGRIEKQGEGEGQDEKPFMIARAYFVFNADQVTGFTKPEAPAKDETQVLANAESFVANTGAVIRTGEAQAYYNSAQDFINMPARNLFLGSKTSSATEGYYSTLLHELGHWTGHKSRLDRLEGKSHSEYAFEELVAELTAAFMCAELGITASQRPDHAAYINNWLQAMKGDSKFIFQAASKAQAACDYLNQLQQKEIAKAA